MGVHISQHVAIRVSDIDRAARFYVDLFDGRYLTRPFTLSGPELEPLFGGHDGLEVRVCLLAFEQGVAGDGHLAAAVEALVQRTLGGDPQRGREVGAGGEGCLARRMHGFEGGASLVGRDPSRHESTLRRAEAGRGGHAAASGSRA